MGLTPALRKRGDMGSATGQANKLM